MADSAACVVLGARPDCSGPPLATEELLLLLRVDGTTLEQDLLTALPCSPSLALVALGNLERRGFVARLADRAAAGSEQAAAEPAPELGFDPNLPPPELLEARPRLLDGVDLGAICASIEEYYLLSRLDGSTSLDELRQTTGLPQGMLVSTLLRHHAHKHVLFPPHLERGLLRGVRAERAPARLNGRRASVDLAVHRFLADPSRAWALAGLVPVPAQRLLDGPPLSAREQLVLSLVDGGRSLATICSLCDGTYEEAANVLLDLYRKRMVELYAPARSGAAGSSRRRPARSAAASSPQGRPAAAARSRSTETPPPTSTATETHPLLRGDGTSRTPANGSSRTPSEEWRLVFDTEVVDTTPSRTPASVRADRRGEPSGERREGWRTVRVDSGEYHVGDGSRRPAEEEELPSAPQEAALEHPGQRPLSRRPSSPAPADGGAADTRSLTGIISRITPLPAPPDPGPPVGPESTDRSEPRLPRRSRPSHVSSFIHCYAGYYIVMPPARAALLEQLDLGEQERRLVQTIAQRPIRLRELTAGSRPGRTRAELFVVALYSHGYIDLLEELPEDGGLDEQANEVRRHLSRVEHVDHFEALNLHPFATGDEVEAGWARLRQRHGDAVTSSRSHAARVDAARLWKRLAQAYETLRDTRRRREYRLQTFGEERVREYAEVQYKKGDTFLFWRDSPREARKVLASAHDMMPANPLYLALLGYATYRCSPAVPQAAEQGWEMVQQAQHDAPKHPYVYAIAARFHLDEGQLLLGRELLIRIRGWCSSRRTFDTIVSIYGLEELLEGLDLLD